MEPEDALSESEKIAIKYKLLREKIIEHYKKGCKILNITKIVIAVFFMLFTITALALSNKTGAKMTWLVIWIALIFLNVGIFMICDYCKYLVKDKVIPYLNDDNQLEFGEYDIFIDNEEDIDIQEPNPTA